MKILREKGGSSKIFMQVSRSKKNKYALYAYIHYIMMFLNIFFFQRGFPENFDPEKGGVFENFERKKGVFENFRRPPPPFFQGDSLKL